MSKFDLTRVKNIIFAMLAILALAFMILVTLIVLAIMFDIGNIWLFTLSMLSSLCVLICGMTWFVTAEMKRATERIVKEARAEINNAILDEAEKYLNSVK